jgi:valyl-tRNA synthetase
MKEMPKAYDPGAFERKWYDYWSEAGQFKPCESDEKGRYVIVIPPPNVTGGLTIGHVLNNTIQDVLIRWNRMQGKQTLWLPGTDHAGIATQNVVKKDMRKRGIDPREMGRDEFIENVWNWKEEFGGKICKQLRYLGCSLDWDRERFTLDEGLSLAVEKVFKHLYNKELIYRGEYLINWCIDCRTALSDEEVEHEEIDGSFWHIRYPVQGMDQGIVVATTRPETMLGDTAVAISPGDERYASLIGKKVILPLMNREIPLIEDDYVDAEFGTGALKITPGHDPNDFDIGRRHDLEVISVIDDHGVMNENAGVYAGMDRFECRKAVVEALKKEGLLIKVEPYRHNVGHCYRCKNVIEPAISYQWFVKMQDLVKPAIKAAKDKEVRFVPERWEKTYLHWLENVRDWCISRQLWWGHRIPIWYCENEHMVLTGDEDKPCSECGSTTWRQDEDVLDTWFSSWLWPFSTLGWPEKTDELKFYPTSTLVTAPDIIFFWVARMIMAGYEFLGEKPFTDIYLHGLVRDEQGRKMSKSLGNSEDPIAIIEDFGADALRFTMLMLTPTGSDILFGRKKVEVGRDFANKLWNAGRFILFNMRDGEEPAPISEGEATLEDRWLSTRLAEVIDETNTALSEYRFNDAAHVLYDFTWKEFCAWYLEIAKLRIQKGTEAEGNRARSVLVWAYKHILALLHPLMPFITEEIYEYLPGKEKELILGPWPQAEEITRDAAAVKAMGVFQDAAAAVRNLRSEMNIPPGKPIPVVIRASGDDAEVLREMTAALCALARIESLTIDPEYKKPRHAASAVVGGMEIFVLLEGVIDLDAERKRLQKELTKVEGLLERSRKKLANQDFLERAKPEVVEKEREKQAQLEDTRAKVDRTLAALED